MRVIVEVFGRAWMLNFQSGKMVDDCESSSQEEFEHVPVDPHSTGGGSFERRSDFEDAVARENSRLRAQDYAERRFGFHGRQE